MNLLQDEPSRHTWQLVRMVKLHDVTHSVNHALSSLAYDLDFLPDRNTDRIFQFVSDELQRLEPSDNRKKISYNLSAKIIHAENKIVILQDFPSGFRIIAKIYQKSV